MYAKEHIQRTIVDGIRSAFNECGITLGNACAYASYLTRDLLKEKYNLDAELAAGEVWFPYLSLQYKWEPPLYFHMWAKLNGEIIDIAAHGIPLTEDFQPGGKFFDKYGKIYIPIVWEKHPSDNRVYVEIANGVEKIESPVDEKYYKQLYKYASEIIDKWNNKR
ncbi:hypothetical protein COL39_27225 [Bacillus cereus]|uniref:hypothetical protein n=1 Tax=Bacillus cereus TaxID=1396 RepID=UPI000BF36703|nr:hypothetical protein [Bacillus cereus]PFX69219.1 hypothetical protein COL39_27225 [Bacillus cereus]